MANHKENPRYNVVSIRVSDEEKELLDELSRRSRKSMSRVLREAISLYTCDRQLRLAEQLPP